MQNYPSIKFTIFFVIGILFQYQFNIEPASILIASVILIVVVIVSKITNLKYFTYFIFPLISLTSAFYFSLLQTEEVTYPFKLEKLRNTKVVGTVSKINLIQNKKLSFEISLESINDIKTKEIEDKIFLCNFWKDTTSNVSEIYSNLEIGNEISFVGTIRRAKNQRNPFEFNYENYLFRKGISGLANCYKLETVEITNSETDKIFNSIFIVRKYIDKIIKLLHPQKTAALLKGLLLADRGDIDYNVKQTFMNTGVIHVLAVSGLHVGFISLILFFMFGRLDIRLRYIFTIIGVTLFLILTGGHPSVFRATVMAVVFLIAKLSNRSSNGFNSLAIAALIILILNPYELFNPGFLLSFSAVLSILILYPMFERKIKPMSINDFSKKILLFSAVSLSAQIGTLPFTIIYFNKLALVSLFTNLIVIPLIGIIVLIGILTLVISSINFWLANIIASSNIMLIDFLYYFVESVSQLSFAFVNVFNFSFIDGIIFYSFLIFIVFVSSKINRRFVFVLLALFTIISMPIYFSLDDKSLLPEGELTIATIDVGQGDAILIKFPNGKTALIDAGNRTDYFDNGERVILPLLNHFGIEKLDYGFITHLDSDHYGGFVSLLTKGKVKQIYKTISGESNKDIVLENYLEMKNIKFSYFDRSKINIGGCSLYFLNDTSDVNYKSLDINNRSGIIKLVYGKTSFLFVGDVEVEGEYELVNNYKSFLKADVLKVGHHGSKTSSTEAFLDLVNPKIGIISAGVMNKFKHPSPVVVERLVKRNITIRRTDKEGAIILSSDGETIRNVNWRE
ncbi:MAG: DNA internalization-related competence protein ComEC/Rec2 [Melioribacteraceae bacterium]